jgi:ferrous iron transport protein B
MKNIRVALAGNPNSGKTTLFNALTGAHLQVGNYPGVTVEKREGTISRDGAQWTFTDLPGIYSLTAYSEDEVVSRDFLINEKPDWVIDVLDMTNLARHLNLAMQLQELGIPVIGALNMVEEAQGKGIEVNEATLTASLGMPFIKINAKNRKGCDNLFSAMEKVSAGGAGHRLQYGDELEARLEELTATIVNERGGVENGASDEGAQNAGYTFPVPARWLAVKLLEKDSHAQKLLAGHPALADINAKAQSAIEWLEGHFGKSSEIVIAEQRYGYIRGAVREAVVVTSRPDFSLTEAIDKVVMNRFLAGPLFVAVLWVIFKLTFTIGAYPQAWLEMFFGFLSDAFNNLLAGQDLLRSLVVDGIIAGVGGVLSFVPLIVILFFFMSILEDLGYMSRAAFATDKLLHTFGLHGQSIFPMMLGFGCSVPAIMASRTLKSKRDRIITVLVTPMMSCGAKLPIHVLLAGAFFGKNAGNMVMLVYAAGVVFSIISAFILQHTVLRGEPTPFVLELPPYRLPTMRGIAYHVWEKTWSYIKRAGCVILAASILVWACITFPMRDAAPGEDAETAAQIQLEESIAGRAGRFIQPVFAPLGFNWRLSVATLTGFVGKEVVASTLSVLYRVEQDEDDEGESIASLERALAGDSSITPLIAFAFMLFILLIPPCFAALATVKAELGWRWLAFEFAFLFIIGWIVAFAAVRIGALFG